MEFCKNHEPKFRYGIISHKHAIIFDENDGQKKYNIKKAKNENEMKKLGEKIKDKCDEHEPKIDTIYFWSQRYICSKQYYNLLFFSGLKIFVAEKKKLVKGN